MAKATLTGIVTEPKYDNNDQWMGANIAAHIEVEAPDGRQPNVMCVHRVAVSIDLSKQLADIIKAYGYKEDAERFIMKRVENCLDGMPRRFPGTEADAEHIYDVIRLKLPRFIKKSVERIYYSQNFRTGEIDEGTERL